MRGAISARRTTTIISLVHMQPEVDALEHFFAAINRNDMQAMIRDFDPGIVRKPRRGAVCG